MEQSVSLLRYLRQLAYEKDRTLSNLEEAAFSMYLDELPKQSAFVTLGTQTDDFIVRLKRPFSSKTMEDRKLQQLFLEFLKVYYRVENENEDLELLLGNAVLRTNTDASIDYPVLTKRVNIVYNAQKEILEIRDSNVPARLDVKLLSKIGSIHPHELKRVSEEMRHNFVHPLSSRETSSFLRGLATRLHLEGTVAEGVEESVNSPLVLADRNLLLLAPRHSRAFETYDDIVVRAEEGDVHPIIRAISGEMPGVVSASDLPGDGLFTKEYNEEQENIVRHSYENPVTLVDGPPGSGKTHTVANMIGHFLAEGKRILILAKKKKALRVLKNMIDPVFAGLVVSRVTDTNDDIRETLYHINEFIANHTTPEMAAKAEKIAAERRDLTARMADTEEKLLAILRAEREPIVFDGEEITPVEAARFVREHAALISLIPGEAKRLAPLPLSDGDLEFLYRTNLEVTPEEEAMLVTPLPSAEAVLHPEAFADLLRRVEELEFCGLKYKPLALEGLEMTDRGVEVRGEVMTSAAPIEDALDHLARLRDYMDLPLWEERALKAGLNLIDNKAYGELSRLAIEMDEFREKHMEIITGKSIAYPELPRAEILRRLEEIRNLYGKKDRIGALDTLFHRDRKKVLEGFLVNGEPITDARMAEEAMVLMQYEIRKKDLQAVYDALIGANGGPDFETGYFLEKDRIFQRLESLYAFGDLYLRTLHTLESAGIAPRFLHAKAPARENPTSEVLHYLTGEIENTLRLMHLHNAEILPLRRRMNAALIALEPAAEIPAVAALIRDMRAKKPAAYTEDYEEYRALLAKSEIAARRREILEKLSIAPTWREFIEKRFGEHGGSTVPENIRTAWKVKQLEAEVSSIVRAPYEKLRKMLTWYKKSLLETNRDYAGTLAWYRFLRAMDENPEIRSSLKGLEMTYKKLGKGTGRDAKELRATADALLLKCQDYVPCWVMTTDDCLETLGAKGRFDIVVVDEASQADILALPVVYQAPKLIAIGDDRQTTPLSSAIRHARVEDLRAVSLSKDFPNYHLMDLTTSFYDVLKATYPSFLLREQFRSVPEIIGYSNALSYGGEILPLRDGEDADLKPALVTVRVDGRREGDENPVEAEEIVRRIRACIDDPRYDGKTIGVISLVGEKQAKRIEDMLMERIDVAEYDKRRLMAGTPSEFQGDERDVMFLSMVDSPEEKPLRLLREGGEDLVKKRYNVAFSRARDQEFLVTSLSPEDLKTGDLRQWTLEYFADGAAKAAEGSSHRLTPFCREVKEALEAEGIRVSTTHSAGYYPLPLVAMENGKIAVIPTGEEEDRGDVRDLLSRTLLLERVGWKLSHVRAAKFAYDPEGTIRELVASIRAKR